MSEEQTIRIGGVPEHFNMPVHQAIEAGAFQSRGVQLEWTTFKGGTGQMTRALRDDDVDLCILLTEGIIADIIKGNQCKIISGYVTTPLTWGIHTGVDNSLTHYSDIFNRKYAISRFGSGSHLMAIVDANTKGHELDKDQFVVIKNLEGALTALENLEADVFYWEKYTTKPYVDRGMLRRIGQFRTPWPCFMIAATDRILESNPDSVIRVLRVIHDYCDQFMQSANTSIQSVSDQYDLEVSDAERWFHSTEWAIHGWVSNKMIRSVIYHLKIAGIISPDDLIPELIWKRESISST